MFVVSNAYTLFSMFPLIEEVPVATITMSLFIIAGELSIVLFSGIST